MADKSGWRFPSTGGGEEDGVNDAGLEMFEGDRAAFLAREVIQNSIDARRPECDHVEVRFKLAKISLSNFPDWHGFKKILSSCLDEVRQDSSGKFKGKKKTKGEVLYEAALSLPASIPVLIASDYNTTGLCGSESEKGGQWYKCIRRKGSNVPAGEGGGTFGIGKHAPFPASKLRTVFYSTINDRSEAAFIGKAILSSFELNGDMLRGTGFYGKITPRRTEGIRGKSEIPSFFKRKEQGLSVFVMGFREERGWKEGLLKAVLKNFFTAIDRGKLQVVFEDGQQEIRVDAKSLGKLIAKYAPECEQYLYALRNPLGGKPITEVINRLGEVSLYLAHGKNFEKKVAFMRRPLIVVETRKRKMVHENYAGVFICEDPKGSEYLGRLEPPTHDKWDAKRDPDGTTVMIYLTEWLNGKLRGLNSDVVEEREDVADLAEYLADDSDLPGERPDRNSGNSFPVPESGVESGAEKETEVILPVQTTRKTPLVKKKDGGGRLVRKKRGKGGAGSRGSGAGNDGPRRISVDLGLRWIADGRKSNKAVLVIRSDKEFTGNLRIVGIGEEGDSDVQLKSAQIVGGKKELVVKGSLIHGVHCPENKPLRLELRLVESAWQAVGVEAYEG